MPKNDMKIDTLRSQFPILKQNINKHPLIYFDNAATAQMPQMVIDAIVDYYTHFKANVGRGIYQFAEKATALYEDTRSKVAQFIHANRQEIVFTSGATHGINIVTQAWAAHHLTSGDEIMVSVIEHHSNFLPWQQLALRHDLKLTMIPLTSQGLIDTAWIERHVSNKTKLIAVVQSSNVNGATSDVTAIVQIAKKVGAKVLVDAAQSVVHQELDVQKIGCDFLVFSGHKLFGPTGIGVLFVKKSVISELKIIDFGGGMVFSVGEKTSKFKEFPYCFEVGTPNVAGVIGLGAAINFVQKNIDFKLQQQHETKLCKILITELKKLKNMEIMSVDSSAATHQYLVTFASKTHHAHDIAAYLNEYGIAVRAGHHCVQLFHQQCNINASVRVSFAIYNTQQEVEFLIECLKKLKL